MSLRHALLGLLAEEPASGYDLAKKFERVLQRYAWHARHSQIYPELNRMAVDGLVTVVAEGARGRRTYAVTDPGRADLRRWMLDPPDVVVVRNEVVLRLFLLSTLDPAEARRLLEWTADANARELEGLRAGVAAFDAAADPAAGLPMGRLVAEFGLRSFQLLTEWAGWAAERIDQTDKTHTAVPDAPPQG
jgi:DNA-binding PadR family transcriptional regulator